VLSNRFKCKVYLLEQPLSELLFILMPGWLRTVLLQPQPPGQYISSSTGLRPSDEIGGHKCLEVFAKGSTIESAGAIDLRWSGTQGSADR
jgi:hypothetical protein